MVRNAVARIACPGGCTSVWYDWRKEPACLRDPSSILGSYPIPDGMEAHAAAVEEDGWDGMLFTDTQNLSMDVFGSLYLAASATSRLG